jgi:ABC-type dipeptide/oligopeptide/nickel transport system permease component
MTQGLVLVLGAIVLLVNFLVDMALTAIDPRTGLSEV